MELMPSFLYNVDKAQESPIKPAVLGTLVLFATLPTGWRMDGEWVSRAGATPVVMDCPRQHGHRFAQPQPTQAG
jgi:hypothetical protein